MNNSVMFSKNNNNNNKNKKKISKEDTLIPILDKRNSKSA